MYKKILYIHHDGSLAGSTISLHNLLTHLDHTNYSPRVLLGHEGPARNLYEKLDISVDTIPIRNFGTAPGSPWYKLSWWLNWRAFLLNRRLVKYLEETEWDLLHINDKALLNAGISAKKFSKPIVWHLRSSYCSTYSSLNALASQQTIKSIANRIIAISEDETDGFENFKDLEIVYNSVNFVDVEEAIAYRNQTRLNLGLSDEDFLIGQVSTIIGEVRGTWDFLDACGIMQKVMIGKPLKFIVVAKIPERNNSTRKYILTHSQVHPEDTAWQIARENSIADRLTMTGYRNDALKIMAAMDVVVVCNRHGVLGRMPFEAMALGRPLVVTAGHSGQSRVVIDHETALVVPPANPAAIAEAVINLLRNPSLAQEIANQGLTYARQHFDPVKNTRLVEEIYRDLLK